jgi:hypothetical protein
MDWHGTVRYNIHMSLEDEDVPLPLNETPHEQPYDEQFEEELIRDREQQPPRDPKRRPAQPQ